MITELTIKNFKSIANDTISLGRVNVFIGENGCGKSNILEAVGFLSACTYAKSYKEIKQGFSLFTDKERLFEKGVRIAKTATMASAFAGSKGNSIDIECSFKEINNDQYHTKAIPQSTNNPLDWGIKVSDGIINEWAKTVDRVVKDTGIKNLDRITFVGSIRGDFHDLQHFLIYCLNTLNLRGLTQLSRISPVGIYGENLDNLIASLDKMELEKLKRYTYLVSWLKDFFVDMEDTLKSRGLKPNLSDSKLYFEDKFMLRKNNTNIFSSENANEGILHVLFYLAVLISKKTPKFFAIDNIESCLNPHLCRHLMTEVCKLAKECDKQLLITTHNPAILDGLNLNDDEVRLFEVYRNDKGHTKTRRIKTKPNVEGEDYKLSELWTRGFLGAISEKF